MNYEYESVLEVIGGSVPSPFDPSFDPRRLTRYIVTRGNLKTLLDRIDNSGARFRR